MVLVTYEWLGVLFLVAMLAGFIDSIAGGGGMLTIPALLAMGLSPTQALATNKLQSVGGSFSASCYFLRHKMVDLKAQKEVIVLTLVGAMMGSILVQYTKADLLRQLLPLLTIAIGLYFLLLPPLGDTDRPKRLTTGIFALLIGGSVGFYDGFFGPGAGSFYTLAYVSLLGFNLAKSTAHAKVLNFISNITALLFFVLGGKVIWSIGSVMFLGQIMGAYIGARLVLNKGQRLIRPMIVVVSLVMSIKLLYDN